MNHRRTVLSVALTLATGLAVAACQGHEDPLPLPPSDASAEASSQHDGAAGDAAAAGDSASFEAEADAAHEAGATEGSATDEAGADADAAPPDAAGE